MQVVQNIMNVYDLGYKQPTITQDGKTIKQENAY